MAKGKKIVCKTRRKRREKKKPRINVLIGSKYWVKPFHSTLDKYNPSTKRPQKDRALGEREGRERERERKELTSCNESIGQTMRNRSYNLIDIILCLRGCS